MMKPIESKEEHQGLKILSSNCLRKRIQWKYNYAKIVVESSKILKDPTITAL